MNARVFASALNTQHPTPNTSLPDADVEMVLQPDGSVLAFGRTEAGEKALDELPSARNCPCWNIARGKAFLIHLQGVRVMLPEPPTSQTVLEQFEREIEPHLGSKYLVIAKGLTYKIGEEPADLELALRSGEELGHGGRAFKITFLGPRVSERAPSLITHNLWRGLAVPHELRDRYTDNATIHEVAI